MTPPPWPVPPAVPPHRRSTAVLAVLAVLLAGAALIVAIVALTKTTPTTTYTANAETSDPNAGLALGRIAVTNAALTLETVAADPALDPNYRDAAHALALAYETVTAMGTNRTIDDPQLLAAIDDSNSEVQRMKELCGD